MGLVGREAGDVLRSLMINVGVQGIVEDMVVPSSRSAEPLEAVVRRSGQMEKFMLSLRQDSMRIVLLEAERRGVSVQELIRAVIIPDWIRENISKD